MWEIIPYLEYIMRLQRLLGEGSRARVFCTLYRRNLWRIFCSRKPVFCREIFALISGQDVKKKIGCRWKLFQFGQHREEDPRRVEVSKRHLQRVKVAAVEICVKSESFCLNNCLCYTIANKSVNHRIPQIGVRLL